MKQILIDNWDKLAALLLSLVAIIIALISSWQTSKQANRQIEELRKLAESNAANADRQVESIKRMSLEALDGIKKQMIDLRELSIKALEYTVFNLEDSIRTTQFEKQELTKKQEELLEEIKKEQEKMQVEDEKAKRGIYEDNGILFFYSKQQSALDKRINYLDRKYQILIGIQRHLEEIKGDLDRDLRDAVSKAKIHGTFEDLYGHLGWPYNTI